MRPAFGSVLAAAQETSDGVGGSFAVGPHGDRTGAGKAQGTQHEANGSDTLVALMLASPASASQWWTFRDWPPKDCVAGFDHGHSPAEWFEYESTIGGDPEILDKEYPGVVGVEFTNSGGREESDCFLPNDRALPTFPGVSAPQSRPIPLTCPLG
jgi:hypothetical protein